MNDILVILISVVLGALVIVGLGIIVNKLDDYVKPKDGSLNSISDFSLEKLREMAITLKLGGSCDWYDSEKSFWHTFIKTNGGYIYITTVAGVGVSNMFIKDGDL